MPFRTVKTAFCQRRPVEPAAAASAGIEGLPRQRRARRWGRAARNWATIRMRNASRPSGMGPSPKSSCRNLAGSICSTAYIVPAKTVAMIPAKIAARPSSLPSRRRSRRWKRSFAGSRGGGWGAVVAASSGSSQGNASSCGSRLEWAASDRIQR